MSDPEIRDFTVSEKIRMCETQEVMRLAKGHPEAQIKLANELEAIRRKHDQEEEERVKGILRSCGRLP